ncbi:Altered inheritance of mitochondria protein 18 mitochondrial [Puttea exsequens]|nr:Altered inheritance of mitochondria protein 18 mitochondrial [Puttea exsequens]
MPPISSRAFQGFPLSSNIATRIQSRPATCLQNVSALRPQFRGYSSSPQKAHFRRSDYGLGVLYGLAALGVTWAIAYRKPHHLDAPPSRPGDPLTSGARVELTGKDHGDEVEQVSTGTSTIPYFPRTIWLPRSGASQNDGQSAALPAGIGAVQEEEEYQLLGLGIRKVSLFRIQVYVIGLYIARSDMGKLQEELVKASVGSGASTLVQGEKQELKRTLLDGEGSIRVWGQVLKEGNVRSAVRIVPTRNTNFSHLRDGWIRGIDLRSKGKEYEGADFQASVSGFKAMLGGQGSLGKGKVLLLSRGSDGALRAWAEEDKSSADNQVTKPESGGRMRLIGRVQDERISRLVWMGYLAGKNIASEEARQSVVEGVMNIVERPLGTIETRVV